MKKIVIIQSAHKDPVFYDVSTEDKLHKTALAVLTDRLSRYPHYSNRIKGNLIPKDLSEQILQALLQNDGKAAYDCLLSIKKLTFHEYDNFQIIEQGKLD